MATSDLITAMYEVNDRKKAASDDGRNVTPERSTLVLAGLGIDAEEMAVAAVIAAEAYISRTDDLMSAVKGAFQDGVCAGILLAQIRDEESR